MSVLIDILILAVFLFPVIKYWSKGLIQAILGFGKFIGAVIFAIMLGRPIAMLINDAFVSEWISDSVYNKISVYIVDGESLSTFFNRIPEGFRKIAELCGVEITELIETYGSEQASSELIHDMAKTITSPLSGAVSAIFAYSAVFLVALLVLSILCVSLKNIKIPIISTVDKVLGLCLGLVLGLLSAAMVATVGHSILEFVSALSGNYDVMNCYYNSYVFKFVNEIRIFNFIRSLI